MIKIVPSVFRPWQFIDSSEQVKIVVKNSYVILSENLKDIELRNMECTKYIAF